MSMMPPATNMPLPANADANYLARAMANLNKPRPNLFPKTDGTSDAWAGVRGMPATPVVPKAPNSVNQYGYAPLTAAAATTPPTPKVAPGQAPAPGAPPSNNDATVQYGTTVAPDVDKALSDALAAQNAYVPPAETKPEYTDPVKDPNAQRHGIASAFELLAAAKSPKLMPNIEKGMEFQQKDQEKDYNKRVDNAREAYQRQVDEQTRLSRESASHEALLEKRVQVAAAAKNLHDANLERAQKDTLAHQIAEKRADAYSDSVISQNARREAMSAEAIVRDRETARNHAAQIGVRNTALADQVQETKWRTAAMLEARGMSASVSLQIANQRQNLALAMEGLRERASDKREFQREGFAANMKATGELLASYDHTLKDASALTATPEQKAAAAKLLTPTVGPDGKPGPTPYDTIVTKLQTVGVSMPPQEETTQIQGIQTDAYNAAMGGQIDMGAGQPGGIDPATIAATVAAAVSGAVNSRGPAGGPGGPTSPALGVVPPGGVAPRFPGTGPQPNGVQPNAGQIAAGAGFNDDRGRHDIASGNVSPALMTALGTAERAGYQLQVTAVRSDHNHPDGPAGHDGGNAIDIGAINKVTVGYNQQTYRFLTDTIGSGQVSVIGTIPQLANDPGLQTYARQHGVVLRVDEGTGPHIHMQVAGAAAPNGAPGQQPLGNGRQPLKVNALKPGQNGAQPANGAPATPPTTQQATPEQVGQSAVAAYEKQHPGQPFDAAWGAMSQWYKAHGATTADLQAAENALRAHIKQQDAARDKQQQIDQRVASLKASGAPQAAIDAAIAQMRTQQAQQRPAEPAKPAAPSVPPAQFAAQRLAALRQPGSNLAEGQRRQIVLQALSQPPYSLSPQQAQATMAQALNAAGAQQPALAAAR